MVRLALALAFLAGCAGSDATSPDRDVPDDLEVVIGQGGGFTGAWDGWRLVRDGTVQSWTAAAGDERSFAPAGTLEAETVLEVWRALEALPLTDAVDEPGNVSRTIEVTADGQARRYTWALADPPHDYDEVWDRVAALLAPTR